MTVSLVSLTITVSAKAANLLYTISKFVFKNFTNIVYIFVTLAVVTRTLSLGSVSKWSPFLNVTYVFTRDIVCSLMPFLHIYFINSNMSVAEISILLACDKTATIVNKGKDINFMVNKKETNVYTVIEKYTDNWKEVFRYFYDDLNNDVYAETLINEMQNKPSRIPEITTSIVFSMLNGKELDDSSVLVTENNDYVKGSAQFFGKNMQENFSRIFIGNDAYK